MYIIYKYDGGVGDLSSFQMERSTSDRFSNRAKTMPIKQLKNQLKQQSAIKKNVLISSPKPGLQVAAPADTPKLAFDHDRDSVAQGLASN